MTVVVVSMWLAMAARMKSRDGNVRIAVSITSREPRDLPMLPVSQREERRIVKMPDNHVAHGDVGECVVKLCHKCGEPATHNGLCKECYSEGLSRVIENRVMPIEPKRDPKVIRGKRGKIR